MFLISFELQKAGCARPNESAAHLEELLLGRWPYASSQMRSCRISRCDVILWISLLICSYVPERLQASAQRKSLPNFSRVTALILLRGTDVTEIPRFRSASSFLVCASSAAVCCFLPFFSCASSVRRSSISFRYSACSFFFCSAATDLRYAALDNRFFCFETVLICSRSAP